MIRFAEDLLEIEPVGKISTVSIAQIKADTDMETSHASMVIDQDYQNLSIIEERPSYSLKKCNEVENNRINVD